MNALLTQWHFLRPAWLLAVLLLPLWLWLWRRRTLRVEPWRQVCDPHLLLHLRHAAGNASTRLPAVLFVSAYLLAVLALAGPAFRQLPQILVRADSALIVALDLSDRMRATDLKPDRISRMRYKIADLLRAREEGQTALIAYAGEAFTVAPLSDDAKSLTDLLTALTPETLPVGGQRAERAIALARRLLADGGFHTGDLLLLTDAVGSDAQAAARAAAAAGLRVSVLGVGTSEATPIALPQGGFLQDENGKVLLPRLDASSLQALAEAGGGHYVELVADASDLVALGFIATDPAAVELRADERTRVAYQDEGPWLLLLLLPLAALAFRRGWLTCLVLALALPAPRADAFDWDALWRREDQRAYQALQQQQAARALELARDPALRGSAAYRDGEYAQAAEAFAQAEGADAHYNRGNALTQAGRYPEALAAYDQALALAPEMEDARANRQAVEDWLKQQQDPQAQPSQKQQQQDPSQSSQASDAPENSQENAPNGESQNAQQQNADDAQAPSQSQDSGTSGEKDAAQEQASAPAEETDGAQRQFSEQMQQALDQSEEPSEQAAAELLDPREAEQRQAVEQWLRRVPDDPGGLLRRKFALEYQRRLRENRGGTSD